MDKRDAASRYRASWRASTLLRTVRSRAHLDRWVADLQLHHDASEADWVVLDVIVAAEQRAGRLADSGLGAEAVSICARRLLRAIGTTGYAPFGPIGADVTDGESRTA